MIILIVNFSYGNLLMIRIKTGFDLLSVGEANEEPCRTQGLNVLLCALWSMLAANSEQRQLAVAALLELIAVIYSIVRHVSACQDMLCPATGFQESRATSCTVVVTLNRFRNLSIVAYSWTKTSSTVDDRWEFKMTGAKIMVFMKLVFPAVSNLLFGRYVKLLVPNLSNRADLAVLTLSWT